MTMMRTFYALEDEPFSPRVNPTWFFASRSHTAVLQTLVESLQARRALTILLGEPGVGKTFLVHAALAHSVPQHITLVHLWYPPGSFHETLQMIGWELGLKEDTDDATQLTHALHRALLTEHEHKRQMVLVIDEAHTLPLENLASLVRLSQVRALTGAPLLQMLLVGLPALWRSFSAPPLRSCTPRTVTRVTLASLSDGESQAYIRHRLQQAGAGDGTVFTPGAVQHVARQAHGNPRVMNELCTHLLLTGFAIGHKPIAAPMARDALRAHSTTRSFPRWWGMTAAAGVLAVVAIVSLFPATARMVTERWPRGVAPFTRSLLAGAGVEVAQHPVPSISSPSVPRWSALPASTEATSSPAAPTERPALSVQGTAFPETPAFQRPPSPSPAPIPDVAQHFVLPLQPFASAPDVPAQQVPRVLVLPSTTAPSTPEPSTAPGTTTRITSPQHGARVAQKIAVEGVIAGLQPEQHVFVCVQSQAFGRLIYPQGKVRPDPTGRWTVESIYGSRGYRYETFLVITTNPASVALLHAQQSRKYGLRALPPNTERLGTAIVVMRE